MAESQTGCWPSDESHPAVKVLRDSSTSLGAISPVQTTGSASSRPESGTSESSVSTRIPRGLPPISLCTMFHHLQAPGPSRKPLNLVAPTWLMAASRQPEIRASTSCAWAPRLRAVRRERNIENGVFQSIGRNVHDVPRVQVRRALLRDEMPGIPLQIIVPVIGQRLLGHTNLFLKARGPRALVLGPPHFRCGPLDHVLPVMRRGVLGHVPDLGLARRKIGLRIDNISLSTIGTAIPLVFLFTRHRMSPSINYNSVLYKEKSNPVFR